MITLVPFEGVDLDAVAALTGPLAYVFKERVQVGDVLPLPASAYDAGRKQYRAPLLIALLQASGTRDRFLGVTGRDLYDEGLNFVFGEADPPNGRAVISLARLYPSFYGKPDDEKLLRERMLKEAVHELGHTYGFRHCANPHCIMYFSNSIEDTDRKTLEFCSECGAKTR